MSSPRLESRGLRGLLDVHERLALKGKVFNVRDVMKECSAILNT
ncbi:MAG: hypothetical protein AABY02_03440 [Nanoarchaeota archaeon]